MEKRVLLLLLALMAISFMGLRSFDQSLDSKSVSSVLQKLGDKNPIHSMETSPQLIQRGKELVFEGRAVLDNGKLSKPISKYFLCTHCHNTQQEDPDINQLDPDARLPYVAAKGIPFLQGSTFWGIVNRESWYNDDYYLKYGEAVRAANHSLRKAIQLCAIECAQGRPLEKWEEDAILAYYWSLELKMDDLDLPASLKNKVQRSLTQEKVDTSLVTELKRYYATTSPAHFGKVIENKKKGYGKKGDVLTGKQVYEYSCRHCHKAGSVSDLLLDYSPQTFKYLKKHMFEASDLSIYQIIRKGTYASPGARPYMPHYPLEKMSDRQIESLRLFIEEQAL